MLKGLLTIGQNRFETSGRVDKIESNESTSEAAGTRGLPVRQCWNSVSRIVPIGLLRSKSERRPYAEIVGHPVSELI